MNWLAKLPDALAHRLGRAPVPPSANARLTRERVYILPTAAGLLSALTVLLILLASINYGLGLGFALSFLLAGIGVVTLVLTYRNLAGLHVRACDAAPVFCGTPAAFIVDLHDGSGAARHALEVRARLQGAASLADPYVDVPAHAERQCLVRVDAPARGTLTLPALRVSTTFPLGLFRAWSDLDLAARCTVYPRPEPRPPPLASAPGLAPGIARTSGDDFAGLRDYVPGDAPAHIAWTALARGSGLVTRRFQAEPAGQIWLRWHSVSPQLETEQALMRLTRWILDLATEDRAFGLDVPGCLRAPGRGRAHVHACLCALACFGRRQ